MSSKSQHNELIDRVPFSHVIAEDVMACGEGKQVMAFRVTGTAVLEKTATANRQLQAMLSDFLTRVPYGITVTFMCHRKPHRGEFEFTGYNATARDFDKRYQQELGNALFLNQWFLLLQAESQGGQSFLSLSVTAKTIARTTRFLYEAAKLTESSLQLYHLSRLKTSGDNALLATLLLPINAGCVRSLPAATAVPLGKTHRAAVNAFAESPSGHLASLALDYHIGVARDRIVFAANTTNDSRVAALCTLKQFPAGSVAGQLDPLYQSPFESITIHRYSPLSERAAVKRARIERHRQRDVNNEAVSLDDELGNLLDGILSGDLGLGCYHQSILILSTSKAALEKNVQLATELAHRQGLGLVRERFGLIPAFFSQLAGNQRFAVRPMVMSSKTVADFASLHVESTGHFGAHHLKQPIALLRTPTGSPYWFNCHASGDNAQMTSGHTLAFGASGYGKTVLLAFIITQLQRFNGRCFVFDRNRGLELAIAALGGVYTVLSPEAPVSLNPFALDDTPENRGFLISWLEAMVRLPEELAVPAGISKQLSDCVTYNYQCEPGARSLSQATQVLPIDFPRQAEIDRWLSGAPDSAFFDGKGMPFLLHDIHGFDLTYLMASGREKCFELVCRYLMHQFESKLDGQLVTLIADEGWQWLLHPALSALAHEIVVTWRKRNGHLILATQTPARLVESPIATTLLENAATKLLLPNALASASIYCESLGLSEAEFGWVKNAKANSRAFLVKQACHSAIAQLDLSRLPGDLSLFSANVDRLNRVAALKGSLGDSIEQWLPTYMNEQEDK